MDKQANSTTASKSIGELTGNIVSGIASSREAYTLDDAMVDAGDLAAQFQAAYDIIHEMDYVHQDGTRNNTLDHLASVMRVALTRAKQLSSDIDTIHMPAAAPSPKASATKHGSGLVLDAQNILSEIGSLNEAIFMAASAIGNRDHMNAIATVANIIEKNLDAVGGMLDAARGAGE